MSNDYYTPGNRLQPYTVARAQDINAEFDSVASAFDLLPSLTALASLTNYRGTLAEAIADASIEVGDYFTSAESGELALYRRIADAPGYEIEPEAAWPVSKAQVDARLLVIEAFTGIGDTTLAAGTTIVQTSGYSEVGRGGGTYVNDSIADADLLSDHPMTVTVDANGLIVRPIPLGAQLELPITLCGIFGSGIPSHGANHQPGLQAAQRYLRDVGGKVLSLEPRHYSVWVPPRVNDVDSLGDSDWVNASDGVPLYVDGALVIEGNGAFLHRRAPLGNDPSEWANFQLAPGSAGTRWRGNGFVTIERHATDLPKHERTHLTIRNLNLMGGIPKGASGAYPMDPVGGDGWDITDKGICQVPDGYSGDLFLENVWVDGFRGELTYTTNDYEALLFIRNYTGSNSNGQVLNPGGVRLDIDGLLGYDCNHAFEGFGYGNISNMLLRDCTGAFSINSGRYQGPATRLPDGKLPTLAMNNVRIERCNSAMIGYWMLGDLTLVDTHLSIGASGVGIEGFENRLRVDLLLDTLDGMSVTLSGSNTPGALSVARNTLELNYQRSKAAEDAGYRFQSSCIYGGSLGKGNIIKLTGQPEAFLTRVSGSYTMTDYYPIFEGDLAYNAFENMGSGGGNNIDIGGAGQALTDLSPFISLYSGTAGPREFWFTAGAISKLQESQRVRVYNVHNALVYIKGTANFGVVRGLTRVIGPNDWIEFVVDGVGYLQVASEPNAVSVAYAGLPPAADCTDVSLIVTDSNSATYNASITASGASGRQRAHSDGTDWKVG